MKFKEIIPIHEGLNYLIQKESESPFKLKAKVRLTLLKNYNSVKSAMDYYNQLKDSAIKEINPDMTPKEDGSVVVSLENEKGKQFLNKLNEILEIDVDDCKLSKLTYDEILGEDNDIPLGVLNKLNPILKEND